MSFVGKKYEAYQKAAQAEGMAKNRLSDAEGGSARGVIQHAKTDAKQAEAASNDAWQQFIEDPEG